MKRIFDLGISCLAIPFAFPICLMAAFAIWLECKASPFFWQVRLGRDEVPFRLLKLRTMAVDTLQTASHEVSPQQILKVGGIIRKIKIDEFPQLWNVLRAEMSLVGPRPGLAMQHELTQARRTYNVFALKPGITGVSQINGLDMSTPWDLAKLDASYNKPWSLFFDVNILYHTAVGKGNGDAAAKRMNDG